MDDTLFAACQYAQHALDWRSAVRLACQPLERQGKVTAEYAQAIISATEQHGPWYILSPEFALPHARPEDGVLSHNSALSLLCCGEAVEFPGYSAIRLIVVLAAADSEQHIQTIQRLVCWLDEEDRLQRLAAIEERSQLAALVASQP
ncbi:MULTISPECIES: PTS sugar transporter subunit IIA [Raoultella]|uniref:PTS sugar transporter subunit IIA n=1 Tax=Raoultella TaxID=160674 RepID=UPI001F50B6A8|nr:MULTISPECIES: PTS sugar transporter subunit IIA [Raoultella]MCI1032532.1 PTS sugar transporter subunit IIA [Raoultella terrigena]